MALVHKAIISQGTANTSVQSKRRSRIVTDAEQPGFAFGQSERMNDEPTGDLVKRLRSKIGLSQRECARIAGVAQSSLGDMESSDSGQMLLPFVLEGMRKHAMTMAQAHIETANEIERLIRRRA